MFRPLLIATSVFMMAAPTVHGAQIAISDAQASRLGIVTAKATVSDRQTLATLPGRVTLPQDGAHLVAAAYAGTVRRYIALEGAAVLKGTPILSVESPDYLAAKAALAEQKALYGKAQAAAKRARLLADEGIGALALAEAAEAEAHAIKAMVTSLQDRLARVQPDPETPGAYLLTAPLEGTLGSLPFAPGMQIAASDIAATLTTGSAFWVEANLPASLIGNMAPGQQVEVEPGGGTATVLSVGRTIDPESRAATLRARLDDATRLAPGMLVRITIYAAPAGNSVNVPRAALIRLDGQDNVFVLRDGGFEPVPVTILARGAEAVSVTGPIAEGDQLAVGGLTELKALALAGE